LIRKAYRQEIANAEKKAMLDAATQASYDLESLIKEQVTVHFAKICDALKEAVADLYSQGLDRLLATLDEDIQSQKAIEARSEQLEQLQQITIPDLKQQLQQAILTL
jgi:methionine synthase I (cobalamin-dependent)